MKNLTIKPHYVDYVSDAEYLTKWQMWGGVGPDPYPGFDTDEHVAVIGHGETVTIKGEVIPPEPNLQIGEVITATIIEPAALNGHRFEVLETGLEYEARRGRQYVKAMMIPPIVDSEPSATTAPTQSEP